MFLILHKIVIVNVIRFIILEIMMTIFEIGITFHRFKYCVVKFNTILPSLIKLVEFEGNIRTFFLTRSERTFNGIDN